MDRIEQTVAEYRSWCEKLGISTISDVNRIITQGKINRLINISEIWHEQNLSEIARTVKDNIEKKKIVMISGPSSSGKTSFATRLQLHLKVLGINSVSISLDDYYLDPSQMPLNDKGNPDMEALESIDYRLFNEHMEQLVRGNEISVPQMNFKEGVRVKDAKKIVLSENEITIIEGLHSLNEKITDNIPDENKYKVYCSALSALRLSDGTRIKSRTTRFIRRIVRDYYFRNMGYAATVKMWPEVEEGAVKNIFPYTDSANIIFNSSLLYELAVYKKHLRLILKDASIDETSAGLLDLINRFDDICDKDVPNTSLVREFIGGSSL